MIRRTRIVTRSGIRFDRLSFHSARNSSEWFFFMTMARRNGAMNITVSTPQMPLAHQCMPVIMRRMNGRKNVNIRAIVATERIE